MNTIRSRSIQLVFLSLMLGVTAFGADEDKKASASIAPLLDSWDQVRLVDQQIDVVLTGRTATFKGTFTLESATDQPEHIFAFPVQFSKNKKRAIDINIIDTEKTPPLKLVEYVIPTPRPKRNWRTLRRMSKSKQYQEEENKRTFGEHLRIALDRLSGYRSYETSTANRWYAYRIPLKAGKPVVVSIQTEWDATELATSESGPCHLFRIPIRMGKQYGTEQGKLKVNVTLPAEVKAEATNILMIKPKTALKTESTVLLELEKQVPHSDLLIVLKNETPKQEEPTQQPAPEE